MISVQNLTKTFGDRVAVDDLSFEVESGEILGFLGPNAAGKTTTMRMLTGFFPPTSGTAVVAGVDIVEDPLEVRKRVGYLPEHVPLYVDMTTREFLTFAARAKKIAKAELSNSVDSAIERCNLTSVADQLVGTLSRGFRQRVGLGQAIVNNPKVLILDEPTVGLDPTQVRDIRKLLREIGKDSTVILSSHIMSEVAQMCSRVVIIAKGEIRAVDTPENLTTALRGESKYRVRVDTESSEDVERAFAALDCVSAVSGLESGLFEVSAIASEGASLGPAIAKAVVSEGWSLRELTPVSADLEDIFIQLVETEKGVKVS